MLPYVMQSSAAALTVACRGRTLTARGSCPMPCRQQGRSAATRTPTATHSDRLHCPQTTTKLPPRPQSFQLKDELSRKPGIQAASCSLYRALLTITPPLPAPPLTPNSRYALFTQLTYVFSRLRVGLPLGCVVLEGVGAHVARQGLAQAGQGRGHGGRWGTSGKGQSYCKRGKGLIGMIQSLVLGMGLKEVGRCGCALAMFPTYRSSRRSRLV